MKSFIPVQHAVLEDDERRYFCNTIGNLVGHLEAADDRWVVSLQAFQLRHSTKSFVLA